MEQQFAILYNFFSLVVIEKIAKKLVFFTPTSICKQKMYPKVVIHIRALTVLL
jgi:hypothetical protein